MSYKGEDETFEGLVVTKEEAKQYFSPLTLSPDKRVKAKALRAILALQKGGTCKLCNAVVQNYNNLYRWHFDHIHDLKLYPVSPTTQILQFRISGSDIARRRFDLVVRHAVEDTQLLCSPCHFLKTHSTAKADNLAALDAREAQRLSFW